MSNKKSNKSKKVNSKISSTKKMNENNIKDVKEALEDDAKKQDIEEVIQKNIESKIEEVKEPEESIIVEQEEADSNELVEENFYKSEVLEKIKTELKSKKKEQKEKTNLYQLYCGRHCRIICIWMLSYNDVGSRRIQDYSTYHKICFSNNRSSNIIRVRIC